VKALPVGHITLLKSNISIRCKKMKRFFSFIIKQSVAVVLFVIFVLAFGVYSTLNMSVNLLPDINVPMVCVQVIYPGANATSVEDDLTKPLEEGLSSISGITEVESYSYDNLSAVVLSFDYGTDTNGKKSDIQSKLATLTLPDGITTSVYEIDLNAQALAVLSLTSDVGEDDAYQKANELSKKLAALDGVESVSLKGGATYSYDVKPFGGLELVSPLIVEAFSYGALDIPLGNISEADGEVQIRNNSDIATVEDIKSMPIELPASVLSVFGYIKEQLADVTPPLSDSMLAFIKSTTGFNLSNELLTYILNTDFSNITTNSDGESVFVTTVGEIATVEKNPTYTSYAYYYGGGVTLNEGNTIIIEVYKSNGANSSAVVKNVKKTYKSVSAAEGYNAKISLLDDQSEFISDSISNVLVSMIIGGVLAILVIFIFLKKVGLSLVIAITMPLSVLAALICLALMGITLNMVSLGGLAVGIGMLVDNSIVVIECISKHRDAGKSAYNAAVDGTVEVGGALFGSTLTTVCVFIPIIFAGGLTAEIFTDLSFAVIYSLAFSLIVAVTVIPTLYTLFESDRRMLKGGNLTPAKEEVENVPAQTQNAEVPEQTVPENTETPEKVSEKPKKKLGFGVLKQPVVMDKISSGYAKLLPKALAHRAVTLIVALVVFLASIGLLFLTGIEFLPSIDKGQIEIDMSYGSGRELSVVQEDVLSFSQVIVDNVDNIDYVSASVGKNGLLALTDTGIITVQLTTNRNTDKVVKKIRKLAEDAANKPIGTVKVKQIDGVVASLMSGSNDMSVTVVGEDSDTLIEISQKIENKLAAEGFIDITNSATDKSRQYTLNFDREKMSELGLDYQTVVLTMRIGIASYTACTATIDGEDYDLDVSFADGAVTNKTELENFVVGFNSKTNTQIHLKDILKGGEVKEEYTEACIRRSNGKSMILVSANLADSDTGTATKLMQSAAKEVLADYNGYSFESSGISSYLNDAFEGLAVALVVSFFLLYAVMAIQFSSFVKPLIVMASIPFSFTGGFIALVITGTSLNVVSFIGLIMLMGVVVNNAIVMLEKIKQLNEDGKTKYDSVVEACRLRLRPILMTTLTTILALVPLAIGVGQGSELMQPLGIVVIGGLLLSTLVTLVLVPTVYCAVYGITPKQKDGRAKGQKDKCGGCR
jgi:HAE1 family hydrophobic/amphiphilic exporter-1